ncbi:hypothetical protein PV08_04240 [Exophiala spinifera]|uniref:Heterokaryon incompatibility domain-containing protein n=1 Tax=Exophiala spinifera TaxID=91928 RepID=A0A0D2C0D0_9EURO|nr:uncharacterized protein PV08_04240 [Exophiala spinifera]KIW17049.1 hypothetical protein PV08_04240 [Exophiala spinifera]
MAEVQLPAAESQAFQINLDQWPEYDGYTGLGDREIRVIDVEAGDPPMCRIRHVSLDEKPHYHALSYYWGAPVTPENLKAVELNGSRVFVRPNIYSFIWHMSRYYQAVTVWLDVLSINQRDAEERNRQVSLMGSIFTSAARVYAWLGEGDADSDYAFDYINSSNPKKETVYSRPILSACFEQLAMRPYWTRIWVLQEIALATSVLIMCGTKLSHWDDFSRSIEGDVAERAPHCLQVMNLRNRGCKDRHLLELMETFKSARCIDPRDKAYGVRALATNGHCLDIDYSESVGSLFFRIASLYPDTAFLSWMDLRVIERSSKSLLGSLSLSQRDLVVGLAGSKADRFRYWTEIYGRVETVYELHQVDDTGISVLPATRLEVKLSLGRRKRNPVWYLYGGPNILPGDLVCSFISWDLGQNSLMLVIRPGKPGIMGIATFHVAPHAEDPYTLHFQRLQTRLVNGVTVCRGDGRKVDGSWHQTFHINRLVWSLILANQTRNLDIWAADVDPRLQRRPVCDCQHKTSLWEKWGREAEEEDSEEEGTSEEDTEEFLFVP